MTTALRRVTAGAGALALALAGAVAMSTTAAADVGPDQPDAPTSGTLTINKYAGAPITGDETLADRDKLDGVEFTVTQVGRTVGDDCVAIDLKQAAAWNGLPALFATAPSAPGTGYCLLTPGTAKDTVDGQAIFNLLVGIYFVQETADHGNNNIVSRVPNFYVSIPTSSTDGWNYNVVANPKNQLSEGPSKTIQSAPSALVVGSTVTWNMTVPVPTLNNNETFNTAIITDTLDSRLTYVANSTVMAIGGTPLTQGTDYAVSDSLVWTLTPAGRSILNANMGKDLTIQFQTVVNAVGTGTIVNAANQYSSSFNGTTVPGTTNPVTYWGQLSILKVDDSTPVIPLEGAVFEVFDNATGDACPAYDEDATPVATGTSDDDGVVQWAGVNPTDPLGLWIANNDDGPLADPSKDYCVYETVVPAGHTASAAGVLVEITPGVENLNEITVENLKTDGPVLPLTGAGGTLAMTLGGLLLVGGGAGAIFVSRRRRSAAV